MNVGDLVKMKTVENEMFWHLKRNPEINYTEDIGTVVSCGSHIMSVMWPDGKINRRNKDFFEVISVA